MKKQMKRTVYEAPVTERFQVELEGSFCGSAEVTNPNNAKTGQIDNHQTNGAFGTEGVFSIDAWDNPTEGAQ